jgi:four helix bundle protein
MRLASVPGVANPKADELKARTKRFALETLSFRRTLPVTDEATDIGRQLSRSATAVAANYRAACK